MTTAKLLGDTNNSSLLERLWSGDRSLYKIDIDGSLFGGGIGSIVNGSHGSSNTNKLPDLINALRNNNYNGNIQFVTIKMWYLDFLPSKLVEKLLETIGTLPNLTHLEVQFSGFKTTKSNFLFLLLLNKLLNYHPPRNRDQGNRDHSNRDHSNRDTGNESNLNDDTNSRHGSTNNSSSITAYRHLQKLQYLDMKNVCLLEDIEVLRFAHVLCKLKNLTLFNLSISNSVISNIDPILEAISTLQKLSHLSIGCVHENNTTVTTNDNKNTNALTNVTGTPKILTMNPSSMYYICCNESLQSLEFYNLSYIGSNIKIISAICQALSNIKNNKNETTAGADTGNVGGSQLKKLKFSIIDLNHHAVKKIAHMLKYNDTLVDVTLDKVGLDDDSCCFLANALKRNNAVVNFDIRYNTRITYRGYNALMDMLQMNDNIKSLKTDLTSHSYSAGTTTTNTSSINSISAMVTTSFASTSASYISPSIIQHHEQQLHQVQPEVITSATPIEDIIDSDNCIRSEMDFYLKLNQLKEFSKRRHKQFTNKIQRITTSCTTPNTHTNIIEEESEDDHEDVDFAHHYNNTHTHKNRNAKHDQQQPTQQEQQRMLSNLVQLKPLRSHCGDDNNERAHAPSLENHHSLEQQQQQQQQQLQEGFQDNEKMKKHLDKQQQNVDAEVAVAFYNSSKKKKDLTTYRTTMNNSKNTPKKNIMLKLIASSLSNLLFVIRCFLFLLAVIIISVTFYNSCSTNSKIVFKYDNNHGSTSQLSGFKMSIAHNN